MKPTYLFLFSLSFASSLRATPESSLGEVTESVLAHNPRIEEARAKWAAMRERVPQSAAWADLRVSADSVGGRFVNISPNGFTDQKLSVEQELPISGKNRSRARIAAAEAIVTFEEARRAELDVVAEARAAYFRLANAWAQLELNRQNQVSLRQIAEISRSRYEVGKQTAGAVLVAETESGKLAETERDLQQKIAEEQSALNVLMNRDAFAPLARPNESALPVTGFSIKELRALTLANRPEVRVAEAKLAAENSRLELAHRAWIPDPALSLQGSRYNDTGRAVSEVGAGISFQVPWSNSGKYSAAVREARSNRTAARAALERAQKESLGTLRDALQRVETAQHHVGLFRDQLVPQAREAFEANQFSYESGQTTFSDWISAQRNLREIAGLAREHVADAQAALADLEAVVGADLKIFPPPHRARQSDNK
jgi:cobalt-zinc-cadmium efflux system outer membrane protein